jgi:hypothetical protein
VGGEEELSENLSQVMDHTRSTGKFKNAMEIHSEALKIAHVLQCHRNNKKFNRKIV